jgi:hypothetical protein
VGTLSLVETPTAPVVGAVELGLIPGEIAKDADAERPEEIPEINSGVTRIGEVEGLAVREPSSAARTGDGTLVTAMHSERKRAHNCLKKG